MTDASGDHIAGKIESGLGRVVHGKPCDYRLARKPNGEIVLQAGHLWDCGAVRGIEWWDRETVEYEAWQ